MQLIAGSLRYGENLIVHPFQPRPLFQLGPAGRGRGLGALARERCFRSLQQLGERAPEPRHDPEWRSLPCRSGEGRLRPDVDQKLGVGEWNWRDSSSIFRTSL